ncbi:MAG: rhomboid family intramembrane serine protease, partial [Candidatus Eisenbacteria bacterium]|nr:rhomboid family intramembrane serine protease [Candidatus Eisenbacteria bacterium]
MNEPLAIGNAVIVVLTVFVSYRGFKSPGLQRRLLFSTRHILAQREYHRLLSSSLIHADWMHLIFNMFSLYSFGRYVEL